MHLHVRARRCASTTCWFGSPPAGRGSTIGTPTGTWLMATTVPRYLNARLQPLRSRARSGHARGVALRGSGLLYAGEAEGGAVRQGGEAIRVADLAGQVAVAPLGEAGAGDVPRLRDTGVVEDRPRAHSRIGSLGPVGWGRELSVGDEVVQVMRTPSGPGREQAIVPPTPRILASKEARPSDGTVSLCQSKRFGPGLHAWPGRVVLRLRGVDEADAACGPPAGMGDSHRCVAPASLP